MGEDQQEEVAMRRPVIAVIAAVAVVVVTVTAVVSFGVGRGYDDNPAATARTA